MSLYHSNKFLPNAIGEHIIEYEVLGDSIDATPFDNILEKGFFLPIQYLIQYPNSNQTDVIGTGHFTGGDDGFKMANLISLLEADEITSVRIGLNRSQLITILCLEEWFRFQFLTQQAFICWCGKSNYIF